MRYTSALVLSTLAAGQVAAHNARHASFHARRQAESKRNMDNVNWNEVSYDLSNVDWSSVFGKPAATPAPAVPSEEPKKSEVEAPAQTEPAYVPATTSQKEEPAPSKTSVPDSGNGNCKKEDDGVQALCDKMGVGEIGTNANSDNGIMWLGEDSPWKTTFSNDGSEALVLFCWADAGNAQFTAMSINDYKPAISVNISPGCSRTISFAPKVPAACAPAYPNAKLAMFGGVDDTWFEATFGENGAFDISRNVNMNGNAITAKGSKCTSSLTECVFSCTGGRTSCEKGYTLTNCGASNGGGGGYDPVMAGVGGGCAMGADGEHIKASISPQ